METKNFLNILNHLKHIFIANNYIEDSRYVFFNTTENIIWAYSDQLTYIHHYTGNLKDDFNLSSVEFALPAKELHALINKIKKEDISISEMDNAFVIRSGRSTNKIAIPTILPDSKKLEMKMDCTHAFPDSFRNAFKEYCLFNKDDARCRNIIFEDGAMVSSNGYTITKAKIDIDTDFIIRYDTLAHVVANSFTHYDVFTDVLFLKKENYTLITENSKDRFNYKPFFNIEDLYFDYSIHLNKDEDISFIDSFLLNYKKPDKKIKVNIINDTRALVVAIGDTKTEETRIPIKVNKYNAGEKTSFNMHPDYFKSVYHDFDYFYVLDGAIYAVNVEDEVERIVRVENLQGG